MPAYDKSDCFEFPKDLLDMVSRYADRVKAQTIRDAAVWSGASKGVIFALFMERAGANIDIVIDINPAKQDKYLAATGLQVRLPAEAMRRLTHGADVFVMNSNYLNEIQELTAYQFNYLSGEHESI